MNFVSVLNSYLNQFYNSVAPPTKSGHSISAGEFYESVIVRAVKSPEFRERLINNPQAVLAELGIE
ncbi:MAG: hypothetical protein RBS57_08275, partial [Desulforhabdus sp.]|nr:hypothetical protein [Desulforhabdus sp.]